MGVNAVSAGPIQQEVGNTATFLASPLASGISGQVLYVDGGYCITGL